MALGTAVDVHISGAGAQAALAEIQRVWHLCTPPSGSPAGGEVPHAAVRLVHDEASQLVVDLDGGHVEGASLPDLMQMLTQAVTRAAIDAQAGRLVMLHAAGIQDPVSGAVVALVAPGGTGKTTAVRTLGPGRGYITDETVAVTEDRTVLPYPKPLSVRRRPSSRWKDESDPLAFGALAPSRPATLVGIVMLDRSDAYAGAPAVEPVPTLDALADLTPHTSHLPDLEKPLQRLAALCDGVGGVVRVRYREAGQLDPLLRQWLGAA